MVAVVDVRIVRSDYVNAESSSLLTSIVCDQVDARDLLHYLLVMERVVRLLKLRGSECCEIYLNPETQARAPEVLQ